MRKVFKIVLFSFLVIATTVFGAAAIFLLIPTNLELEEELLIKSSDFCVFYDTHNLVFGDKSDSYTTKSEVNNELIKNAFVASEDKNFYRHDGIDHLRIIKSALVNLRSGDFSQGASTISQQLIKNTHLTNEKTLKRKLKEIKLAQKLERTYSKDEILNMYLNSIYFGENCYGVKSAANYYFSKPVEKLDLSECATLAGIVPSPTKYNPITNLSLSRDRRDIVLSRMLKNGYIDEKTYLDTINKSIKLQINKTKNVYDCYRKAALNEIYSVTDLSPYELASSNIYTYYDGETQNTLCESKTETNEDYQAILIDNEKHGIVAYYTTCGEIERSPASAIKPILVYAPAIDVGSVYKDTIIADEPTAINGYSPSNYGDRYYGNVTVGFALAESLNVPAVKLYDAVGIRKCKKYLDSLGINDENDSLNMALGQFDKGITLRSLASAYTAFSDKGRFSDCRFVRKITDKYGRVLYEKKDADSKVFSEGTATVINEILKDCALYGTARKLCGKDYELCAKTGTLGNERGNTDAYVVAYTSKHTLACWQGYSDSRYMPNSATGANTPCFCANYILDELYKERKPENFEKSGVKELFIDRSAYEKKGEFLLAAEGSPYKDTIKCVFTDEHYPTAVASKTLPHISEIKDIYKDGELTLEFTADENLSVLIEKYSSDEKITAYDGVLCDYRERLNDDAVYIITPYRKENGKKVYGESIEKSVSTKRKRSDEKPDRWWLDE